MKRRSFLALSGLSAASLASGGAVVACRWPSTPEALLRSGPMLGDVTPTAAAVWLQTRRPARVELRAWPAGSPSDARTTVSVETREANDYVARCRLDGLRAGTKHEYEVLLDGKRVERPYPLAFTTKPATAAPVPIRFALGSCAYVNDAAFDGPGGNVGDRMEIFGAIADTHPDVMLWLGDNWYYRGSDLASERAMRYRAAHTRSLAELQPLLASASNHAMWDDHDFGQNDSDRTSPVREAGTRVFRDYWMNDVDSASASFGVAHRFAWSDVDVFMLDDRTNRTPDADTTDPHRQMFGDAQVGWLVEALAASTATFKLVAGGNQMLNRGTRFEAFASYPAEQGRLFDAIAARSIPGVVFLSGDRHHTELIRRTDVGPYPFYDFTSSALTSRGTRNDAEASNPDRVDGTWVTATRNFGLVDVSGPASARVLTVRAADASGAVLWTREIAAAELVAAPKG